MGALPRAALALAALLGVSSAVLEVHVGTSSVFSVEGQQVVLPAWYTSRSQKKPYVTWLLDKEDADPFQILTYLDGVVKVEETELKPRVGFLYPVLTHNISLFINATRERDSGQYMCTVNVVDDATGTGKNVGVINLTVLVPPAAPACQLHGTPTVGANVTLSCTSAKGKPPPAYRWQRTAPTLQVFFPPAQDPARGTLKLTNLSMEMSGLYVCVAENRAGSAECSVALEVHSSESSATGGRNVTARRRWPMRSRRTPWPPKRHRGRGAPLRTPSPKPAPCPPSPGRNPTGPNPPPTLPPSSPPPAAIGDPRRGEGDAPPTSRPPRLTEPPGTARIRLPPRGRCPPPAWHGRALCPSWCQHRAGLAPWCDPPQPHPPTPKKRECPYPATTPLHLLGWVGGFFPFLGVFLFFFFLKDASSSWTRRGVV
ncbi:endothelial cell-selective adhesion molecule isoform X2 [Grus americana]|uniref:endothelial cell-selective adhesion molecule isoform X2 n=1 Tax=Grus americana TaxID=9117 RepID=UPI002407AC5A|nr:endothelial cell-selective adhesion molecule isoform X2 [Grus americana]